MPALVFPALVDGVVTLRQWREADITQQLDAFGDPLFQNFSDWAPRNADEALRQLVDQEESRLRGEQIDFALVDPDDLTRLYGGASLNDVDRDQARASVGYWLGPDARGRGVMSRAVKLICRWAFGTLGLARLEITCGPDNTGSQQVAQRCGFRREGLLRSHMAFKGSRRDTAVYGLLPSDMRY